MLRRKTATYALLALYEIGRQHRGASSPTGIRAGDIAEKHHLPKAYAAKIRARKGGKVEELPPIEPYVSYAYQSESAVDPFESFFKEEPVPAPGPKAADNGIHPDPNRNKEELEAFPLDALRMMGTLQNAEELWAIVRSPDGTIRRVSPGNYMGKNFGKITGIFEDHIELTEIVPDGRGGWVEREAQLALLEQ